MNSIIKIHEHLFQIYPSMPKYAADPSESIVIKIYDHIMLRFAGHYGCQPSFFVKSPLCPVLFGDAHKYVDLGTASFCSTQNVIIAIGQSNSKKIRLNHYQTTLFGEIQLKTSIEQWKFDKVEFQQTQSFSQSQERIKSERYNLVMKILRAFCQINNLKQINGLDILVYKDFIQQQYLYSKEAFIYGLYTAIHACNLRKVPLQQKTLHKAFQKIVDSSNVTQLPQLINCSYNNILSLSSLKQAKYLPFPSGYDLLIVNSMTPQPQKLIKGKRFNLRECEVQIGIELIMSQLGIVKNIRSIKQLMQTMQCDARQMLNSVEEIIPKNGMNAQKIQGILQTSLIEILKHIPYANNVVDQNTQFYPYRRLKFFLQQQLLIQQLNNNFSQAALKQFFKRSSKNSKQLLNISSQQIEQVQKIVNQFGADSKIIGNGWGGCLAIICKEEISQKLEESLIQQFYLSQKNRILLGDQIQVYIRNVGKPQVGLAILDPTNQIWYG